MCIQYEVDTSQRDSHFDTHLYVRILQLIIYIINFRILTSILMNNGIPQYDVLLGDDQSIQITRYSQLILLNEINVTK